MSRLPSLPPVELEGAQTTFYDELSEIVSRHFGNHFTTKSSTGSFIGPFGIFMLAPSLGRPFFELTVALSKLSGLSTKLREIAILTVGTHFKASYELYAHENVAKHIGLSRDVIEKIQAGKKPDMFGKDVGGEKEEDITAASVVYDVSKSLVETPGPLRQDLYDQAVESLGQDGTMALIQFVGFYAYTCIILNGFDAKVPMQ